jgi:hypothetical protein
MTRTAKSVEISKGIKTIGLCLWFEKSRTLACADFHLGYEGMLNAQGIFMPRYNFNQIKERLEGIIKACGKPENIIVCGDFKQEFGGISKQEWKEALEMLDFLLANCTKLVLIKGNHDNIIAPIAEKKGVAVNECYFLESEKTLFVHGHKKPNENDLFGAKIIVMGHEHPSITLRDDLKRETYKCFLKGKYEKRELIVLPSMLTVGSGTDLTMENHMSPLIENIEDFEVYAVEDKTYYLGKLKDLERKKYA